MSIRETGDLEATLRKIENHVEVARGGVHPSVYAVHVAQADLRNNDVPYLLELVRSQAAQLTNQKETLETIERIAQRSDDSTPEILIKEIQDVLRSEASDG